MNDDSPKEELPKPRPRGKRVVSTSPTAPEISQEVVAEGLGADTSEPTEDGFALVEAALGHLPPPPFPVGTLLQYVGASRLFAGYEQLEALTPGCKVTVTSTVAYLSLYRVDIIGGKLDMVITPETARDWIPVER